MRRLLILVTSSLIAAACGGGPAEAGSDPVPEITSNTSTGDSSPPTTVDKEPSDFFEDPDLVDLDPFEVSLSERLDETGIIDLQTAVDLFSAVYGVIPQGNPAAFPDVDPRAGTLALIAMAAHLDELTPEQREAVLDVTDGPDRDLGAAGTILGAGATGEVRSDTSGQPGRNYEALVARYRDEIASRIGRPLGIEIRVVIMTGPAPPRTGADAQPRRNGYSIATGMPDECLIRFWPSVIGRLDDTFVAHEVFHCFQFAMAPDIETFDNSPVWVIEGQAFWVEDQIAGLDRGTGGYYRTWLCRPGDSLSRRTQTAIGFYATIEHAESETFWGYFDNMYGLSGAEAVEAIGWEASDVARVLATGRMNADGTFDSPVWDFEALGAPRSACRQRAAADVDHTFEWSASLSSFAASPPFLVDIEGEVVKIQSTGDGAIEFFKGTFLEWEEDFSTVICLIEGGCECPDGSPIGDLEASPGTAAIAVGSPGGSSSITIQPLSVEDACQVPQSDIPRLVLRGDPNWELLGGLCYVDDAGFLTLAIGYVSDWDGRLQEDILSHGHALIFVRAIPGTWDTGTLYIWPGDGPFRDGDGSLVITLGEDLLTGTFAWDKGTGSFSCPRLLSVEEVIAGQGG